MKIIVTKKWSNKVVGIYSDREIIDLEFDTRLYSLYTQKEYDDSISKNPLTIIPVVKKTDSGKFKVIKHPIYKLDDLKDIKISTKGNFFKEIEVA